MRKASLLAACVLLSGCETIGNWADDLGSYMPVLSDERCEHWQCFTEGGRQQSEMNKRLQQQRWQRETMEGRMDEMGEEGTLPPSSAPDPTMMQYYQQYYAQETQAGRTPLSYEEYERYVQEYYGQQQPQPAAPQTPPPGDAETNPYDYYEPPIL